MRVFLAAFLACASIAVASTPPAGAPLLPGFGDVHRPVSTQVAVAQTWYDQGFQQAYAFDEAEAVRAFKAALKADPACAMCAWGVAWQLGPNFNHPRHGDLSEARRYALMAQQLLPASATPLEQGLVAAMVTRYGSSDTPAVPAPALPADVCGQGAGSKAHPLDLAYARAIRIISDGDPADPDLQALNAEAELIAFPGPGYAPNTLATLPRTDLLIQRIEGALRAHPRHTGLIHYLTHAADTPADAARAAAIGATLAELAPNAPHLVHMPSHLYVRLGRFADAARTNQAALDAQVRLAHTLEQQGFALLTDWNAHNRRFLWIAAQQGGDRPTAMAQAGQLAASAGERKDDWAQYLRAMPLLTMVHFEQWREILDATGAGANTAAFAPNVQAHARGLALLRTGQNADIEVQALEQQLATTRAKGPDAKAGAAFAVMLLAPLKSEQALARGDKAQALLELRQAVLAEPDFTTPEPPLWAASAQRNLGQALLRMGDFGTAEATYRADLRLLPGNAPALQGLQLALRGKP
ncbi:MAG: hypothetical protein V4463_14695 [Pseudomonadota bacterium]